MLKRIALITDDFLAAMAKCVHTVAWKSPVAPGGKKYITVKAIETPGSDAPPYFYTERLGKDSVAFLLFSQDGYVYALKQWHGPTAQFNLGAFTGSCDKPDLSLVETVCEEAMEEAGFLVGPAQVLSMGSSPVSGNTNEIVHLYLVDITGLERQPKQPENMFEANMDILRGTPEELFPQMEWKGQVILARLLGLGSGK